MKVGDLVKFIFSEGRFSVNKKIEIIEISEDKKRILLKFNGRSTVNGGPFISWEEADEYVVDVVGIREERLNELGI
jgi:hypothetical protein